MKTTLVLSVLMALVAMQDAQTDRIKRVGNEIKSGTSGADFPRTAFLLHETALADGVLFAFSAYFRNLNPVYFQLWRLQSGTERSYRLINEWLFQPAVSGGREDLYVHSRAGLNCTVVKRDDRLGLYFELSPGSVTYNFDSSATDSLRYIVRNGLSRPQIGDNITFDPLAYPYRFSAAAYIDSEMSNYDLSGPISCPTTLSIPRIIPPTGGIVGATGPQGPEGPEGPVGPAGPAGPQGPLGPRGAQGATGLPGPVGAAGPAGKDGSDGAPGKDGERGPAGPPGAAATPDPSWKEPNKANSVDAVLESCSWCSDLLSPYLILGLIIWLALVTILLLVFIFCVTYRRRKNKEKYTKNLHFAGSQNDLWKNYYETGSKTNGPQVPSYENPNADTYDSIEEGRTAF